MQQYQLSPQEIRLAKMQGLSLNDLLGLRAQQAPMMASPLVSEMGMQSVSIQRQQPMSIPQMTFSEMWSEQPVQRNTASYSLLGMTPMIGNNLVQRMKLMSLNGAMTASTTASNQQNRQRVIPIITPIQTPISITGQVTHQDQKRRQDVIVFPISGITPITKPDLITKGKPDIKPTITGIPFVLPFGLPGSGRGIPSVGRRGTYRFKEVSPTWTPGEMGRSLFTMKFPGRKGSSKGLKPISIGIPTTKKVRKRRSR
jgi:hypothetical protein